MSSLQYTTIPQCATQIRDQSANAKPKLVASISTPSVPGESPSSPTTVQPTSPTKQALNISNLLLSSSLHLPNPPPTSPRDGPRLLSTHEPLSLQATTTNFRRFVSKSGPIFWLQDRVEEVVMWKKGGKLTCSWMAIYAFLCFFPRMFLLLPHLIFISLLLTTYGNRYNVALETSNLEHTVPAPTQQPKEGSVDWYANLQAIQNLMGAVSDLYDAVLLFLPTLTWSTPHTSQLLTISCVSLLLLVPVAVLIPLRPTLLLVGLTPLAITHPLSLRILPALLHPFTRALRSRAQRYIDDDNLVERHWFSDKRNVELWENERWTVSTGWSKSALKVGDRKPWTLDCDGRSDIVAGGSADVSIANFTLPDGYEFIETEDWRLDREAKWKPSGTDDYGWVYMNDSWLDPKSAPLEEWKSQGMTRRRRWTRRIYFRL